MTNMYTTPEYVGSEVRASATFDNDSTPSIQDVNRWISEAGREIDLLTGSIYSSTTESSIYLDYDGSGMLRLPYSNVNTVTVYYNENHINESSPNYILLEEGSGKNYIFYSDEGELVFINGNYATNKVIPTAGPKKFRININHGDTRVPLEIQQLATLIVAKRIIMTQINTQANSEGGPIQVGTISIGDPGMFSVNYLKSLTSEIDRLKSVIRTNFNVFRQTRVY